MRVSGARWWPDMDMTVLDDQQRSAVSSTSHGLHQTKITADKQVSISDEVTLVLSALVSVTDRGTKRSINHAPNRSYLHAPRLTVLSSTNNPTQLPCSVCLPIRPPTWSLLPLFITVLLSLHADYHMHCGKMQ